MIKTNLYSAIKKQAVTAACFLMIFITTQAQDMPFAYDTCKQISDFRLTGRLHNDILFYGSEDAAHFMYYTNKRKSKPVVYNFDEQVPLKGKTITIRPLPKDPVNKRQVFGFAVTNTHLAIAQWEGISLFERKGSNYIPLRMIPLPNSSEYIHIRDSAVIMGSFYNYHPLDSKQKFFLRKISMSGKVTDSITFSVPYPELLMYSPKKLITFAPDYIYAVQPSPFRIYRLSYDFKQTDSFNIITGRPWQDIPADYHTLFSKSFKGGNFAYYPLLDSFAYNSVNRIEEIHIVGDSLLLCREIDYNDTAGKTGCIERYVHIINRYSGKLVVSYKQTGCTFDGKTTLQRNRFPIWSSMNYPVFYGRKLLIEMHYASPYTPLNTSYTAYKKRNEAWLKKNKPVLNMWLYTYCF